MKSREDESMSDMEIELMVDLQALLRRCKLKTKKMTRLKEAIVLRHAKVIDRRLVLVPSGRVIAESLA